MIISLNGLAKEKDYLLYNPNTENIKPIQFYFNGAFDVIQNPYWFSQDDYFEKHKVVWNRVKNPFKSIEEDGGWKKFFKDEFFTSRVFPNVGLHTIGGGYDSRLLREYFEDKGYKYPMFNSIAISYLARFGNEAIEATNTEVITSHDHIADLYIFDVAGIILFQNDKVVKFFRDTLQMSHWHYQPIIDVKSLDITNAGLNYIFRPNLFDSKYRPFFFMGMQTMLGVSYEFKKGEFVTLAPGMSLTDPLAGKGRFLVSLSYDKEDDLNWNLILNGSEDYRARLNIFPAFTRSRYGDFGVMAGQQKGDYWTVGAQWKLPLGIGLRWK
jgi:hypothetical protein